MKIEFVINKTHPDNQDRYAIRGTIENDPNLYWFNQHASQEDRVWLVQKPGDIIPPAVYSGNCLQMHELFEVVLWNHEATFDVISKEEIRAVALLEKRKDPFSTHADPRLDPYFTQQNHQMDISMLRQGTITGASVFNGQGQPLHNPFITTKIEHP